MTRTRLALALTTVGLFFVAACGAAPAATSDVAAEAYALQQVGLETGLEQAAPAPSASAGDKGDKREQRRDKARTFLRKNTLHGEITVEGKDGPRTVVVQRGTVTAADGRTLSVKSTDGFALTWTISDDVKVVQDKKKVDATALKVGAEVGVAGAKTGDVTTARLVRIG